MNSTCYFRLLGQYNAWMNEKLYQANRQLSGQQITEDRGAYFGSILGTLNHIMVGDILWLKRFALHPRCYPALQALGDWPQPQALDQVLHTSLASWWQAREGLDSTITAFTQELEDADLALPLRYTNRLGEPYCKLFGALLLHFFNHQTHHRGQITTLLSQQGVDVGATDLAILIPEEV